MKRWMAALLAFTLLMSAVPVPAFAQAWQIPEVHIHEVQAQTEEPEVPTEEEVPETPTEPEEPTEPETPTEPEEPTEPEVPEDKEEPAECEHQYESVVTEPGCTQGGIQHISVCFADIHIPTTTQNPEAAFSPGWSLWNLPVPRKA